MLNPVKIGPISRSKSHFTVVLFSYEFPPQMVRKSSVPLVCITLTAIITSSSNVRRDVHLAQLFLKTVIEVLKNAIIGRLSLKTLTNDLEQARLESNRCCLEQCLHLLSLCLLLQQIKELILPIIVLLMKVRPRQRGIVKQVDQDEQSRLNVITP